MGTDFDEGQVGGAGGDGLEGESAEASLAADPGCVGWTLGSYGDKALAVVAVSDGDDLAVSAEEVAGEHAQKATQTRKAAKKRANNRFAIDASLLKKELERLLSSASVCPLGVTWYTP